MTSISKVIHVDSPKNTWFIAILPCTMWLGGLSDGMLDPFISDSSKENSNNMYNTCYKYANM